VIVPPQFKRDGVLRLDLLRVMEARSDLKTDQLEIGGRKFPLRSVQIRIVHTDLPSLEVKRMEPDVVGGKSEELRWTERQSTKDWSIE
jgi:hypothetical protein